MKKNSKANKNFKNEMSTRMGIKYLKINALLSWRKISMQ
jgi:hypothetical protein